MRLSIIVACAVWALYMAAFGHMYVLEGAIATERKEVDALKRQQEQALALRAVKADVKQNVEVIADSVITQSGRVDALEYIESLAKSYSIQAVLQDVQEQATGNPDVVTFTLAAQGSWRQIYTLMRKIETMQYIASIDEVELQKFSTLGTLAQSDNRSGDVISVGQSQQGGFGPGWRMTMKLSVLAEAKPAE